MLLAVFFFTSSCDNGFAELNQNPGAASGISPDFQMSYTQLRTSGGRYENWRAGLIYSSTMIQHMAAVCGYWTGDKYTYNAGYSSSLWERGYGEQVREIEDLIFNLENNEEVDAGRLAIANIWKVVIYHRLTDMYGDTPYSEAGRGFNGDIKFPKYDSQEDIYADMIRILKESSAALGDGNSYGSADFVYGGDHASWKKFANSLLLRLGMRMSKVNEGMAESVASDAFSAGVMTSSADNAKIKHEISGNGVTFNGFGEVLDKTNGFGDDCPRISASFMALLEGDPRQGIIAAPSDNDSALRGLPNGLDATTLTESDFSDINDYSRINPELVRVSSPMFFMTHAETELLLAEAAVRGWINSSAASHYEAGVRSAMQLFDSYESAGSVSAEEVDAYLSANPFDEANAMEQINNQFYIATLLNEYEAWSNWRRTGYPVLTPIDYPGNESGGQIPRRMRYSQGEYGVNAANIEAANANQGPDQFTTRVWWDSE